MQIRKLVGRVILAGRIAKSGTSRLGQLLDE